MITIETPEDLKNAIEKYFSSKSEFVRTFNQYGPFLEDDVVIHQIAGRRGLSKFAKAAYSIFFFMIDLSYRNRSV